MKQLIARRTMKAAGQGYRSDGATAVSQLQTALQAVRNPETYVHTGDTTLARHRVNLAERAKAMTGLYLFQIEGLIRASVRAREKGICDVVGVVHSAWLRWLQLHGRRARTVVPNDGWLLGAFPETLLTTDKIVLGILGNSVELGHTDQASSRIRLPAELLAPANLIANSVRDPNLGARIAGLLSTGPHTFGKLGPGSANSAPDLSVASRLIGDLSELLTGKFPSSSSYPGH